MRRTNLMLATLLGHAIVLFPATSAARTVAHAKTPVLVPWSIHGKPDFTVFSDKSGTIHALFRICLASISKGAALQVWDKVDGYFTTGSGTCSSARVDFFTPTDNVTLRIVRSNGAGGTVPANDGDTAKGIFKLWRVTDIAPTPVPSPPPVPQPAAAPSHPPDTGPHFCRSGYVWDGHGCSLAKIRDRHPSL